MEQNRHKELYDEHAHGITCNVGDKVWLHCPAVPRGHCQKLHRPWQGPFTIVKVISGTVYCIQGNVIVYNHTSHLTTERYLGAFQFQHNLIQPSMIQLSPRSLLITQHIISPQHKMTLCQFKLITQTRTKSPQNQNNILLRREMLNQILHHHLGNHTGDTSLPTDMAQLSVIQAVTLLTQTVQCLMQGRITLIMRGSNVTNGQCVVNGQYVIACGQQVIVCTSDSRLYTFIAVICQHLLPGLLVCTCFSTVPLYTLIGTMHQCWIFEQVLL